VFKSVISKVGKLYLFQNHLCFESNVFGSKSTDAYPLRSIVAMEVKKGTLKIETKNKKANFSQIQEMDPFVELLKTLWNEIQKKGAGDKKDKSDKKSKSKRETESTSSVTMASSDWDLLLTGASLVKYKNGEYIVREGKEHQRIYQIAQGSCTIKKNTTEGEIILASLEPGALFGEMTFLENGKATASVIAKGSNVAIYMIEGWYINTLFVDHPNLAGRFYSYLATILSKRLSDREEALAQQQNDEQEAAGKKD